MNFYIISTARLGLRKWTEQDTLPFIEMNKDKEVMEYFPNVLSAEETLTMLKRIDMQFQKTGFGLYAVEAKSTNEFIGYTGFSEPSFESFFTPCIEIGWRLKRKEWGNGYATEAAKACLDYGFTTLGFKRIFSFTSLINIRSENIMKKIGMVKISEFNHPKIDPANILWRHILYMSEKHH